MLTTIFLTIRQKKRGNKKGYDEEQQKGSEQLCTSRNHSEFEVLCESQNVPKIVKSRNPMLDGVVLLHPSKNELLITGQRRGGKIFEVEYGDAIVRFYAPGN